MFRRRDEDEIEYTLQPANRNSTTSGFAATNQAPGQMISTHAPNNMPYNPAAHSLAQQQQVQSQPAAQTMPVISEPMQTTPPATSRSSSTTQFQSVLDNVTPKAETKESREPKISTQKASSSMNTFVPSAIRASSNANNQQNMQSPGPSANQAPKQPTGIKVDNNIGLETERRLTVGYGISLEGKVSDCDKLVIYGNVNAELNNVKALQISDSGCFRGAAEIDYAEISGIFEGELRVRKNITISSTGRVSGKITYNSIEIKPGGKFTGEIIEAKTDSDNASASATNEQRPGEARSEDFSLFSDQKVENRAA